MTVVLEKVVVAIQGNNGSNGTGYGSVSGGNAGSGENDGDDANKGGGGSNGGGNGSIVSNGITGGELIFQPSGGPASPEGGSLGSIRGPLSDTDLYFVRLTRLDRESLNSIDYVYSVMRTCTIKRVLSIP